MSQDKSYPENFNQYPKNYSQNPYPNDAAPQMQPPQDGTVYKTQNSTTHLIMGVVAGAAVTYLLTNKNVRSGIASTGEKAWSAVRGEVEELKERLEDTQAELEYYRNLHKGD
ncbi:hypothetical protein VA7868_02484 [Vibrio aerogenes CECT 7868]|uniref:Uncharacterized protein n=1 Tax=Vibrio aerogenes CECT 7868 TaxID=1216006 RepID=A0A1M5ZB59_9VIBR|nr:YtxH domain-containing protein [Vibrio aerogenes]SHI21143.1 hypothetical protein VA7868_02484 [Vibrio aerogenes CECT 7868]